MDNPIGFKILKSFSAAPFNSTIEEFVVPASDSTALFLNDPIKTTGQTDDDGIAFCTKAAPGDFIRGVIVGFVATHDHENAVYRQASIKRIVKVCQDPFIVCRAQVNAALTNSDIGKYINIDAGTGNTTTGISAVQLDYATINTNAGQAKIFQIEEVVNTDDDQYSVIICMISKHELLRGIVGTENFWDRVVDVLTPHFAGDDVDLGTGDFTATNGHFTGKLTVDGLIDPTALILDGQSSEPTTDDGTTYYDLKQFKFRESGQWRTLHEEIPANISYYLNTSPTQTLITSGATDLATKIGTLVNGDILEIQTDATYNSITIPSGKSFAIRVAEGYDVELNNAQGITLNNGATNIFLSGFIFDSNPGGAANNKGSAICFQHEAIVNDITIHNCTFRNNGDSAILLSYHQSISGDNYTTANLPSEFSNRISIVDCHFHKASNDPTEGGALTARGINLIYVKNCMFDGQDLARQIHLQNNTNAWVLYNQINRGGGAGNGEGIKIDKIGSPTYSNSGYFIGNKVKACIEGIDIDDTVSAFVINNICSHCSAEGISLDDSSQAVFIGNISYNNNDGIRFEVGSTGQLKFNFAYNNTNQNYLMDNGFTPDDSNSTSITDSMIGADMTPYDNTTSGSNSTLAQTALDEIFDSQKEEINSGFLQWTSGTDPNTYTVDGTGFQIDRAGEGYIKGKKLSWIASQKTGVLTANNTSYIYIDSTGTIQLTTTRTDALYEDNIVLFECLFDGTIYEVVRENHPYNFQTDISNYLHNNVGTVIRGIGATVTRVATGTGASADDRRIKTIGADDLEDHGLETSIPETNPVSWDVYNTNGSGAWVRNTQNSEIPMLYNNAGTPTAITLNRLSIYTLYVSKDDIEISAPEFFTVMDTSEYASLVLAQAAITNGANARKTNELDELELAQLGYAIVRNNASGGYIEDLIVAKDTFNSKLIGGAVTGDHNLLSNLQKAAASVNWGHIDDQAQTIAGSKTFTDDLLCQTSIYAVNLVEVGSGAQVASLHPDHLTIEANGIVAGDHNFLRLINLAQNGLDTRSTILFKQTATDTNQYSLASITLSTASTVWTAGTATQDSYLELKLALNGALERSLYISADTSGTGNKSVAVGALAGKSLGNIAFFNTMFGYGAGEDVLSGTFNTLIGGAAGNKLTTGDNHLLLGASAGENLTTETGNVFIGFQVGQNATAISNKLWIDNTNTATPLIQGDFSANTLKINGALEVTGKLTVGGIIDPTALILDPQGSVPSTADGTIYYNSGSTIFQFRENGAWVALSAGGSTTFAGLTDVIGAYTTGKALWQTNSALTAMYESTTILQEPAANQFRIERGTTQLGVSTSCNINQDLSTISNVMHNSLTLIGSGITSHTLTVTGPVNDSLNAAVRINSETYKLLLDGHQIDAMEGVFRTDLYLQNQSAGDLRICKPGGNVTIGNIAATYNLNISANTAIGLLIKGISGLAGNTVNLVIDTTDSNDQSMLQFSQAGLSRWQLASRNLLDTPNNRLGLYDASSNEVMTWIQQGGTDYPQIGINAKAGLDGLLTIDQNSLIAAVPVLSLVQVDTSEGFINFVGSFPGSIATSTTDSQNSIRIEINGSVRRIPYYADV